MLKQINTLIRELRLLAATLYRCQQLLHAIYRLMQPVRETNDPPRQAVALLGQIYRMLVEWKGEHTIPEPPDPLRDRAYAMGRIGISEKTVYRLTREGKLPIAEVINRRKFYRESDIEACRQYYRG